MYRAPDKATNKNFFSQQLEYSMWYTVECVIFEFVSRRCKIRSVTSMHRDIMLFSVCMLSLVWSWRRHLLGHVYRKTAQWAKEGIAIRNFRTEFRKRGKICADEKGACKDVLFFKKNICAAKGISKRRCMQAGKA